MNNYINNIIKAVEKHSNYRNECINLIASENLMSPITRAVLSSDLGNRYTVGSPGNRWYAGSKYYDDIEEIAINLSKKLFHAKYVNVQPISGMVANLAAYYALLKPEDTIMTHLVRHSGHYSHVHTGMLSLFQVQVIPIQFDERNYTTDIEKTILMVKKVRPNVLLLGSTEFLFPAPIKELREICNKTNTRIMYDAAHVSGLIAGQVFQSPMMEGADLLSMSTNKTLSAPDHGIIACNNFELYKKQIEYAMVPMFTSNHHAHHIAGLAVTLSEFNEFGHDYAKQVIQNAKALARELNNQGVDVLYSHKDFTESHTVLIDSKQQSFKTVKQLEDVQIITNSFQLPWNNDTYTTGIRLGTNELTKLGMKEKEMKIVGKMIADRLFKRKSCKYIRNSVKEFRKSFQEIYYCYRKEVDSYGT